MTRPIEMSEAELQFVLQLLDIERRNLPAEIHHTDSPTVEQELKQRKKLVDDLVTRLQAAAGQA